MIDLGPVRPGPSRVRLLLLAGCTLCLGFLLAPPGAAALRAQEAGHGGAATEGVKPLPTIEAKTKGMEPMPGYFDLYWDGQADKLYLEVDRFDHEFLYQESLATGLGSNPVGLDRGQEGTTRVLVARRVGRRILFVQPNLGYRARSGSEAEKAAVREAFAPGTVWGFDAVARTGDRWLVDATPFFIRDAHGVVQTLKRTGQGDFKLDASRSTIYLPRTKAFPKNTEVEAWLTYTSPRPGPLVRRTAADAEAVSMRAHYSLVQLPDDGYRPRRADPRVGTFAVDFQDYAVPIDQDIHVRWATRHLLVKKDPTAAVSEPVKPLVYYVDPGIPEPIRSAVMEGISWWSKAFEAAGFENAFQVKVLPDSADPMDLRYNIVHWTHRRTRGWSYGASVVDPRTGEILKANVNLGSLRLRQDHLIGQGLVPSYAGAAADGAGMGTDARGVGGCDYGQGPSFGYLADLDPNTTPTQMALARVRQLAAHEVGHTLGLAHNFMASTYGRASVMDYPAPVVKIRDDGTLDLSDAYGVGVGAYDLFAIRWLYSQFPKGTDEAAALDSIVQDGLKSGYGFITDADARPAGAAHPLAALWDNGSNPVDYLEHELQVRRVGLEHFGPDVIRKGEPMASLEYVLVPLYLHHRYQLNAAAHSLGGDDYRFAMRGDGQTPNTPVAPAQQEKALREMLSTLDPSFLAIPSRILDMIPPPAYGMAPGESFDSRTAPVFDPLGVAASSARFTLDLILQPQRMARLVAQHARNPKEPGLGQVLDRTLDATWRAPAPDDGYRLAIRRTVDRVFLDRLLEQAGSGRNTELVRAELDAGVRSLRDWLAARPHEDPVQAKALEDIQRWMARPQGTTPPATVEPLPPGDPIGSGGGGR
ncbi:MAG: zinc-dependent metalloprotease [Candidatus Palauibacterales bacterium]|nr:zinc-dependent metalloprotease [Candidatus Palauibacterales bacterium]MDP2529083.1 zinc-dependent metalloprotease [Candidatus Palauibacterales bacterium]MDP2584293.1 zinc-dependent metalloprotease [Candidatus Palauibacterales bacterium]